MVSEKGQKGGDPSVPLKIPNAGSLTGLLNLPGGGVVWCAPVGVLLASSGASRTCFILVVL